MDYATTLLNRLESYRQKCGSGRIHNTNVHIAVLSSYQRMQGDERFNQPQVEAWLKEAVRDAEKFLMEAVK